MPTLIRKFSVGETIPSTSDCGGLHSRSHDVMIGQVHRWPESPTSPSCDLLPQTSHATPLLLTPTKDFHKRTDEWRQCPPPPHARRVPMIISDNAAVFDGQQDLGNLSRGITVVGTVNSKALAKHQVSFDDRTGRNIEYRHRGGHGGKDAKVRVGKQRSEEADRRRYISKKDTESRALTEKVAEEKRRRIEQEEQEAEARAAAEEKQRADEAQRRRQIADDARLQKAAKSERARPIKENKAEAATAQAADTKGIQIEQHAKENETRAAATEEEQKSEEAERRFQFQGKSRLRKEKEARTSSEDSATQGPAKKRKVGTKHKNAKTKDDMSSAISSRVTTRQSTCLSSLANKVLKPLFEVNDKVFAPWWPNAKRKSQPSWYSGVITGYNVVKPVGEYGPTRHYTVGFDDDNEVLQDIEDAYVFSLEDYNLSMFDQNGGNGRTQWIGVKNVTDENSSDLWAKVVGWYEASIDGETHSFPRLSDALRAFDACVIAKNGHKTKKSELNLPNEMVHESIRSK